MRVLAGVFAALLASSLAEVASAQINLDIPGDWQHQARNGVQFFNAPGGQGGVTITPIAPGQPDAALNYYLGQFRQQYPDLRVADNCVLSQSLATATLYRNGPGGPIGERMAVTVARGSATLFLLWAPANSFPAMDAKLTGGSLRCPAQQRQGMPPQGPGASAPLQNRPPQGASAPGPAHGYLGIDLAPITPGAKQAAGLDQVQGAIVMSVAPGSPAAQAGIRAGDFVIGIEGHGVGSVQDVIQQARNYPAGSQIGLTLLRPNGGQVTPLNLRVTLGTAPPAQ
jgi:hypothetical protein